MHFIRTDNTNRIYVWCSNFNVNTQNSNSSELLCILRSIQIPIAIGSNATIGIDSEERRKCGGAIIGRYSPFLRPNTGEILISLGPHLCVTYETMNGWQMFILVSDTVARYGYKSLAWLPATSSEYWYRTTFCFNSTKTFSFPRPRSSAPSLFIRNLRIFRARRVPFAIHRVLISFWLWINFRRVGTSVSTVVFANNRNLFWPNWFVFICT